jgi:repressor LexA
LIVPRKPEPLSDRHKAILEFIQSYRAVKGFAPSLREIGEHIGVGSTSLVTFYLTRLQEDGYITRDPYISRSIVVVEGARI